MELGQASAALKEAVQNLLTVRLDAATRVGATELMVMDLKMARAAAGVLNS